MSLFDGLNIAKNTLKTQTIVINTIAHNVANANTPGFSRQRVILTPVINNTIKGSSNLMIGAGVEATEIIRIRFGLYDQMYRKENQDLNDFKRTEELMYQVELLFDEPSDRGMNSVLNKFFNGWQEVANVPQNMAARQSLKSMSIELTTRMNRIFSRLQLMREDINSEIATIPSDINLITSQIADLNASIRLSESQKTSANDLRDKRDQLVDELSEFASVRAIEQKDGTYTILIGTKVVVERKSLNKLSAIRSVPGNMGTKTVIVAEDGTEFTPEHGKLGALIKFRDNIISKVMDNLNVLAETLVKVINFEHRIGYGLDGENERNFFDPARTKAFNIRISDNIDDVTHIAVSGDGAKGDNANALNINSIKDLKVVNQRFTLGEHYSSMITEIGIWAREAKSSRINEELLVSQVDNAREGIKGVSIDEELILMIQTQRIYQSASRIIVVLDSLLEDILRMK